jgi:hypothetical protein
VSGDGRVSREEEVDRQQKKKEGEERRRSGVRHGWGQGNAKGGRR